ncbi:MAG: tRNA lysidine(34) synthetase TilS [Planctomycetes bacterium]|nr:tRNA lysidine(34) synthetase TilS [Planctomycetota bacterium]
MSRDEGANLAKGRRAQRSHAERIVAAWRRLSGGSKVRDAERRTLVACSGGADSAALAIALAGACAESVVVAYVAHDIRDETVVRSEQAHVKALADSLACGWASVEIQVKSESGNLEAVARRKRYAALTELARANGCKFIATGHQATDQLETVLMRLMRGTGHVGLRGIAERRRLATGITLIRPMLSVTRQEAEALCAEAGYVPLVDATNTDQSLLRNAVRARVIPILKDLAPGVEARVARTARLASDSGVLIELAIQEASKRCDLVLQDGEASVSVSWSRSALRQEKSATVRWLLWQHARQMAEHADRVDLAAVEPVVRAIFGNGTDPKVWTISTVRVEMTARRVTCTRVK